MTQQHVSSDKYCQYSITQIKKGNMLLCTNKKGAHPQIKLTLKEGPTDLDQPQNYISVWTRRVNNLTTLNIFIYKAFHPLKIEYRQFSHIIILTSLHPSLLYW